jgi:hypothetical protein
VFTGGYLNLNPRPDIWATPWIHLTCHGSFIQPRPELYRRKVTELALTLADSAIASPAREVAAA